MASFICFVRTGAHGPEGRPACRQVSDTQSRQCRASFFAAADRVVFLLRGAHIGTWARDCLHCSWTRDGMVRPRNPNFSNLQARQSRNRERPTPHFPPTFSKVSREAEIPNRGLAACGALRVPRSRPHSTLLRSWPAMRVQRQEKYIAHTGLGKEIARQSGFAAIVGRRFCQRPLRVETNTFRQAARQVPRLGEVCVTSKSQRYLNSRLYHSDENTHSAASFRSGDTREFQRRASAC
jgi:hypothetical protein